MKLVQRIRRWRIRSNPISEPDAGGETLRALWSEYTADPYRQALDLAADRRGRP